MRFGLVRFGLRMLTRFGLALVLTRFSTPNGDGVFPVEGIGVEALADGDGAVAIFLSRSSRNVATPLVRSRTPLVRSRMNTVASTWRWRRRATPSRENWPNNALTSFTRSPIIASASFRYSRLALDLDAFSPLNEARTSPWRLLTRFLDSADRSTPLLRRETLRPFRNELTSRCRTPVTFRSSADCARVAWLRATLKLVNNERTAL